MTLEEAIKENSKLYCTNCWDSDVLQLAWINPNTNEVYHYVDWEDSSSCLNCSEYFDLSTLEDLWDDFIECNKENGKILEDLGPFEAGTSEEDIINWFKNEVE